MQSTLLAGDNTGQAPGTRPAVGQPTWHLGLERWGLHCSGVKRASCSLWLALQCAAAGGGTGRSHSAGGRRGIRRASLGIRTVTTAAAATIIISLFRDDGLKGRRI